MRKLLCLLTIFALAVTAAGCGSRTTTSQGQGSSSTPATQASGNTLAKEDIKVGFIFVGPVGDGGWSDAHNIGRLALEEELGVETIFTESVPEGPESEKVIRDMIDQGVNVLFATSYGYMDYVEKVAKDHPEVKFLHCSGYLMADNMTNYFGRIYQARYLSGIVAGLKTQTNKIGYVAAFSIPEVVRGINAFTLGVQSVNPEATVSVRWTHTWYDPALEKEAAKALLDEGADIIAQHQDTAGPQVAAEEKGAWSIGYNTDMKDTAPKAYMTAPIWNWGPYYIEQVQAVMDGTWKAESYWKGMDAGIVELAPLTENAPADAQAKVDEIQAKILDGSFKIFEGLIKDQNGEVRVQEGQAMTDAEMLSFDWFVQGVEGKIEQ